MSGGMGTEAAPIRVLDIGVEWFDHAVNDPSLCFLLDRKPEYGRYDKRPCAQENLSGEQAVAVGSRMRNARKGWHLYWAQDGDFAWFFTWGGKPDNGFGGWRRMITLTDGTEEEIVGGWHVGASAATEVGHPQTIDVAYRTDYFTNRHTGEKRLGGGTGCFITEERFRLEIEEHLPAVEVVESRYHGLTVKWRDAPSKAEHVAAESLRRTQLRDGLKVKYPGDWWAQLSVAEKDELTVRPYSALGS